MENDPDFLDFIGNLKSWDNLVTDFSFTEVGGVGADDMGELTDDEDVQQAHKKVKFDPSSSSAAAAAANGGSSRLVKKGGKVRGETLEGLEYATTVVATSALMGTFADVAAGSSSSSSSSSGLHGFDDSASFKTFTVEELVSRSPDDLLLARVPRRLYDALGRGQFKVLRRIVDEHFDEHCAFRT